MDSWAVLPYLDGVGPAATIVANLLAEQRHLMTWINLGEVHCVPRRAHGAKAPPPAGAPTPPF